MAIKIWTTDIQKCFIWTTPVKSIWSWDTQVRPSGWQPWANTIAYYPLDSSNTVADLSGNGRNLTNNSVSFGTYQWVSCASVTSRYQRLTSPTISFPKTLSLWTYREGRFNTGGSTLAALFTYGSSSTYKAITYNEKNWNLNTIVWDYGGWVTPISWQRFNLVIVNDSYLKIYVNGNLTGTYTKGTPADYAFYFFAFSTNVNGIDVYYGGLSNVIMENKTRTAEEISNYYNQTKSNYGL